MEKIKNQWGDSVLEKLDIFMLFSIMQSKQIWNEALSFDSTTMTQ